MRDSCSYKRKASISSSRLSSMVDCYSISMGCSSSRRGMPHVSGADGLEVGIAGREYRVSPCLVKRNCFDEFSRTPEFDGASIAFFIF